MSAKIRIVSAANTLAPAYAALKRLGFTVSHVCDSDGKPTGLIQAENEQCVLSAEDPLILLGLARLVETRGTDWRSTGAEVDEFLGFQADAV